MLSYISRSIEFVRLGSSLLIDIDSIESIQPSPKEPIRKTLIATKSGHEYTVDSSVNDVCRQIESHNAENNTEI